MKGIRRPALFLTFLIGGALVLSLLGTVFNQSAKADTTLTDPTTAYEDKAASFIYYRYLRYCYQEHDVGKTSLSDTKSGYWFNVHLGSDPEANLGYLKPSDGTTSCTDGKGDSVTKANTSLGFKDNLDAFCSIQPVAKSNGGDSKSDCLQGTKDFDMSGSTDDQASNFGDAVHALHPNDGTYTDADVPGYILYVVMKNSLVQMCGGGAALTAANTATSDGGNAATVTYVDPQTGEVNDSVIYKYDGGKDDGSNIPDLYDKYGYDKRDGGECNDFANGNKNSLHQYADSYSTKVITDWNNLVANYFKDSFKVTAALKKALCGSSPSAACVDNITIAYNSAVDKCVQTKLQGSMTYSQRKDKMTTCLKSILPKAYDAAIDAVPDLNVSQHSDGSSATDSGSSCAVEGIGWIVCPVMNFIFRINDGAYKTIDSFLTIKPELLSPQNGLYSAWQSFRDLANVAFIISMLIIVYSQITGAGVTNYGIKKLLPRLIIAAILVNISYYICQIAVDLSNILGSSLKGLFGDVGIGSNTGSGSWVEQGGSILANVAIYGTAIVLLVLLIFEAPAVLIILGAVFLLLAARQAIIALLVAISPLAFVAYLLPNTEQWFTKWRKLFFSLLMVFPVVAVLFGASALAAKIVQNAGGDTGGLGSEGLQVLALGIASIPLFAVPAVLKGSMAGMGAIGAKINGFADKGIGKGTTGLKQGRFGEAKAAWDARRQEARVKRRLGKGRIATFIGDRADRSPTAARLQKLGVGRLGAALDKSPVSKYVGGDRGAAAATAAYHKAAHEETERQEALFSESTAEELLEELHKGGPAERQAAILRRIVKSGGDQHVQAAYDYLAKHAGEADVGDAQQLAADALLSRKPAGVSSEDAHSLTTGKFNLGDDGKPVASGYMDMLAKRVKLRKLGAGDYARMQKDDLVRLAELSASGRLNAEDKEHIDAALTEIKADETLKGTMTGERQALFDSIAAGTGPMNADHTPRAPLTPI